MRPELGRTARSVLTLAGREARRFRGSEVGTEHLLLGLVAPIGSDSARALEILGVSEVQVRKRFAQGSERDRGELSFSGPYSARTWLVIADAMREAKARGEDEATSGDLLMSLTRHQLQPGRRFLARLGVTPETVAAALAQAAEPLDVAADPHANAQPDTASADSDASGSAPTVDVSVECSQAVLAPPDRAWELMSSPQAWSLNPRGCAMFEVPDSQGLWVYFGPLPGWMVSNKICLVFERSAGQAPRQITLSARTKSPRLSFTFSVGAGLAGDSAEIRVMAATRVADSAERSFAARLRAELNDWLNAIQRAVDGDTPWPSSGIPPHLVTQWAAEPTMEQPRTSTAVALIEASRDVVWNVITRPAGPETLAGSRVIHKGRIPGTPIGEPGEAWYHIHRRDDGSLYAHAFAVTQWEEGRLLMRRDIAGWLAWPERVCFRLATDDDRTRLEVEYRWPGAATVDRPRAITTLTDGPNQMAARYKAAAETTGPADDGLTPEA